MTVNVFNSDASSEFEKMNNYLHQVAGSDCIPSANRKTLNILINSVARLKSYTRRLLIRWFHTIATKNSVLIALL
jgi:hypothetical protein